jgi:hypothetical protein
MRAAVFGTTFKAEMLKKKSGDAPCREDVNLPMRLFPLSVTLRPSAVGFKNFAPRRRVPRSARAPREGDHPPRRQRNRRDESESATKMHPMTVLAKNRKLIGV